MNFNDACWTYESGPFEYEDFPRTAEPVCILGRQYSALYDLDELRHDILSRLWFTYRKNFSPIGGIGPNSDSGWGCMLRCGQMILAQSLILRHLGRDWRWDPQKDNDIYMNILKLFQDKKNANYSIQQIASMGVSEGKLVGNWFGPNTIAQVLKKLVIYDEWSSFVMHIAMDNTVIADDIRTLCKCPANAPVKESHETRSKSGKNNHILRALKRQGLPKKFTRPSISSSAESSANDVDPERWKPILLVIPLRLGLSEINTVYLDSLKKVLLFKQSVGIIGGKPNHALWFIGYLGDEIIYLDPHTTQTFVDLDVEPNCDESFHCPHSSRMKMSDIDPSMALGFYCGTEAEFDDLCDTINSQIIFANRLPMFELHKERPPHWPALDAGLGAMAAVSSAGYTFVGTSDTEEEFELL